MEGMHEKMGMNWEQALRRYEEVIACESETLQVKATIKLGRISKDVPEMILTRVIPVLAELLGKPVSSLTPSVQEAAAYCLNRLACRGDGNLALVIGQSGSVPCILRLLQQSDGRFQKLLIKCLCRIVTYGNPNRAVVFRNNGLEVVLNLFDSCSDDMRPYLLEIFSALALLREVRRVIISLGALPVLLESASSGNMVSRARAAQAVGLLGVTRRVRRMLVEMGVIPVLTQLLREGDASTKIIAGNALGIIASHVDYLRPVAEAGAIPLYADLLQGPEHLGKEIAGDVFCILAVAESSAVSIAEHLVRILRGDNDEAKAAAADILWDLAGYKHSVSVVRSSGAVPILVDLLRDGSGDVREKVSGAVAQLSYDAIDRQALAEAGVIPLLINLLQDESEELKDNAAEALINFSEDSSLRGSMSAALDIPSFQNIQTRVVRIRASDEHMVRYLREMSSEPFTRDPELA